MPTFEYSELQDSDDVLETVEVLNSLAFVLFSPIPTNCMIRKNDI
jgi:hypothetical protein